MLDLDSAVICITSWSVSSRVATEVELWLGVGMVPPLRGLTFMSSPQSVHQET